MVYLPPASLICMWTKPARGHINRGTEMNICEDRVRGSPLLTHQVFSANDCYYLKIGTNLWCFGIKRCRVLLCLNNGSWNCQMIWNKWKRTCDRSCMKTRLSFNKKKKSWMQASLIRGKLTKLTTFLFFPFQLNHPSTVAWQLDFLLCITSFLFTFFASLLKACCEEMTPQGSLVSISILFRWVLLWASLLLL